VGAERHGRHRPARPVQDGQVGATTALRPAASVGGQRHVGSGYGGHGDRDHGCREWTLARSGWRRGPATAPVAGHGRRRTAAETLPTQGQLTAPHCRVATAIGRQLHRWNGPEHGRRSRGQIRSGT